MSRLKGEVLRRFYWSVQPVKDAFDRARDKASIEDLHFHDLRHAFGSRRIQMGIALYRVKALMGHRSSK